MAGLLQKNNYRDRRASLATPISCMVNTCGFIGAAKEESIDTILEIGRLKEAGKVKKLVVAGCLSQRYPDELGGGIAGSRFFYRHRRSAAHRRNPARA